MTKLSSQPRSSGSISRRHAMQKGLAFAIALPTVAASTVVGASTHEYPTKPIRLTVISGAGSASDVGARRIAPIMSTALGQPVIVENKVGAGGVIAATYVAKSPADGHTVLIGSISSNALNAGLYKKLPYDVVESFEPISRIYTFPNVLVVPTSLGVNSVAELRELAKKRELSYASLGNGTTAHLCGELLRSSFGTNIAHIPYKDLGQYIPDLLSERTDLTFVGINVILEHIKAGKVKALAVTTSVRSPLLPNVPTTKEAGIADVEMDVWIGLFAPKGTPPAAVTKLTASVQQALADPAIQKSFLEEGSIAVRESQEQFRSFVAKEARKWTQLIQKAGIEPQ